MPGPATLARMYGPDYERAFQADASLDDPKQPLRTVDWLKANGPGTFLDYGCGSGALLGEAARLDGWRVLGLELDGAVARQTEKRTGLRVFHDPAMLVAERFSPVDALHLGDVIEHLTDMDRQLPEILQLLKPGGVLLAQGPLEANDRLMTSLIRATRLLGRGGRREGAPYHVLLATANGQLRLFRRFGLEPLTYSIHQVSWPCPERVLASDLKRPRVLALHGARRASMALGRLFPGLLGNRYFFIGRRRRDEGVAAAVGVPVAAAPGEGRS
jgi:SAM-dependent methyltransferase